MYSYVILMEKHNNPFVSKRFRWFFDYIILGLQPVWTGLLTCRLVGLGQLGH